MNTRKAFLVLAAGEFDAHAQNFEDGIAAAKLTRNGKVAVGSPAAGATGASPR